MPRANKKVVGLMKDECNGDVMLEFVGLRSKIYSVRIQAQKPIKKAKGVKSSVVKANIDFEDYVRYLREQYILRRSRRSRSAPMTTSAIRYLARQTVSRGGTSPPVNVR